MFKGSRLCECFRVTRHMDGRPCTPLAVPFRSFATHMRDAPSQDFDPIRLVEINTFKIKRDLVRKACSQGSGHGRERARASCGTAAAGTTCPFSATCPGDRDRDRACLREDQDRRNEPPSPGDWRAGSHKQSCRRRPRRSWHRSREPQIPANASLLRPPPCSPELYRVETPFPVLKHREFATRVFESAAHVGETRRRGVEGVHPQGRRDHADHGKGAGRAVKCGLASIRGHFLIWHYVSAPYMIFAYVCKNGLPNRQP